MAERVKRIRSHKRDSLVPATHSVKRCSRRAALDHVEQVERENDHQYQAKTTGRVITPASRIRPSRKRSHDQQENYDQQDQAHTAYGSLNVQKVNRKSGYGYRPGHSGRSCLEMRGGYEP
jgi:hypothetical protein